MVLCLGELPIPQETAIQHRKNQHEQQDRDEKTRKEKHSVGASRRERDVSTVASISLRLRSWQ